MHIYRVYSLHELDAIEIKIKMKQYSIESSTDEGDPEEPDGLDQPDEDPEVPEELDDPEEDPEEPEELDDPEEPDPEELDDPELDGADVLGLGGCEISTLQ